MHSLSTLERYFIRTINEGLAVQYDAKDQRDAFHVDECIHVHNWHFLLYRTKNSCSSIDRTQATVIHCTTVSGDMVYFSITF